MLLRFSPAFLLSIYDFIPLSLSDTLHSFNANYFKLSEAESLQVNILISICYKEVLGTAQTKEDG